MINNTLEEKDELLENEEQENVSDDVYQNNIDEEEKSEDIDTKEQDTNEDTKAKEIEDEKMALYETTINTISPDLPGEEGKIEGAEDDGELALEDEGFDLESQNENEEKVIKKEKQKREKEKKIKEALDKSTRKKRIIISIVVAYLDIVLVAVLFIIGIDRIMEKISSAPNIIKEPYFAVLIIFIVLFLLVNIVGISLFKDAKTISPDKSKSLLKMMEDMESIDGRGENDNFNEAEEKVVYRNVKTIRSLDIRREHSDLINIALENGLVIDNKSAREILASIAGNRLLIIKEDDKDLKIKLVKTLNQYFGSEFYYTQINDSIEKLDNLLWSYDSNGRNQTEFTKCLSDARQFPDTICFNVLDNVKLDSVSKYFKDFFEFVKNPDLPCNVRFGSRSVNDGLREVARNQWFIFFVGKEDKTICPSEIAKYAFNLELKLKAKADTEEVTPIEHKVITYSELFECVNELYEDNFIEEETWKKLDEFEEYLAKRGEYFVDNRIVRALERFAAIYLGCEGDKVDMIDALLTMKLLLIAIPNEYKLLETDEESVVGMAEKILGADFIVNSQVLLKQINMK